MQELTSCPVCGNNHFSHFLNCTDYYFSKKDFNIVSCDNCGFRFTNPRPSEDKLQSYYFSDNYISHSDSKKGIISYFYYLIRNHTIKQKFNLINNYKSGKNILDIGCGTGEFLNFFKNKNWNTTGIEPSSNARTSAENNYNLSVFDEDHLNSLEKNSFDVITMWHVLEHVSNLRERITQVKNLLANDGILVIALPNSNSFDSKFYGRFWAAWDVPRHLYHFTESTFNNFSYSNKLNVIKTIPMKFDSYYVSLLSEKYKSGRNQYLSALFHGLKSNLFAKRNNNYSSLIYILRK